MKKNLLTLLFFSIMAVTTAFAQSRKITGRVSGTDDGQPIPGVTVKIAGTTSGVQTDNDGLYTINASTGQTLVFSFIGYDSKSVIISAGNRYDTRIVPNNKQLSEVVVTGYGSQAKRTFTGSSATINAKSIKDRPVVGLDQALQGQAAGVQVTSASGTPGGGVSIRVRGTSSINASSQPLYVVDGTPINTGSYSQLGFGNQQTNALNDISPDDIESIEVLKDAAAAAIYGSRASNGVIIVTTKRGKIGSTKVDLGYYTGFQNVTKKIPTLTGPQYIANLQEAVTNRYSALIGTATYPTLKALLENGLGLRNVSNDPSTYGTTNWQEEVFDKNAPISNYNLSINGGNEKTRFSLTSGYFDQKGTIKGSEYKRINLRLNLDHNVNDKFKVGTSIGINRAIQNRINNDNNIYGVLSAAILESSAIPIYNADGTYAKDSNSSVENPVAAYKEPYNLTTNGRILANVFGEYKILPYLTFRTNFGADYLIYDERRFLPTTLNAGLPNGSGTETHVQDLNTINENTLTFNKTFNKHNLTVLLGQAYQKDDYQSLAAGGTGFSGNTIFRLSAASVKSTATSGGTSSVLESYFARANYNFDEKYLFSASIRDDASSRFGVNKRNGYFPSVSAGWRVSEESFLKNVSWLSNLKLRGSYGLTGNYNIGDFASRTLLGVGANYNLLAGYFPSQLGNPNLTWENTKQTDLAVDLGFFGDRLTLSVDVYNKRTDRLLLNVPLVGSSGFTGVTDNVGAIQNRGLDIDLQSVNIKTKDFSWNTNFNISFNRNKVLALANNNAPFGAGFASWIQVGQPLGAFRGYKVAGIFQTQQEINDLNAAAKTKTGSATANYQVATTAPGDIKFADLNGDGVVTSADQEILGSAQPKFVGGLTNSLRYKDFDFSFFWQFSYGSKVYNNTNAFAQGQNSVFGQFAAVLNHWTPTNTNTNIPRAVYGDPNTNNRTSDRFLENGSYARLKSATLGYTLDKSAVKFLHVRSVRLYAAAQNLFTITKYSGFDPELSTFSDTNTSPGTDFLTAPQAKTFTFGVNVGF
ncbi:SusC/RagA family TonB-linked outer membrane protein [Mucilaginibacter glaciei]|uniref:TonB-dependent receptor n=1 Tax=Mucilaginibacter glaciei TaxID=2772109 RepID=A0A926S4L1_9SPHI|nr:TonB-dependent receptor [Mucilaginibacter glaciei]MBD1391886.1 TonB-dependent receptor [Mucilaginibacter glaciei]